MTKQLMDDDKKMTNIVFFISVLETLLRALLDSHLIPKMLKQVEREKEDQRSMIYIKKK